MKPWASNGKQAGVFKEVRVQTAPDQKKTRFTFLTVSGAGHMVPQDKPEAALDMMTRWIKGSEFA
jgi:cathepsin A (carboxypeptidase C)